MIKNLVVQAVCTFMLFLSSFATPISALKRMAAPGVMVNKLSPFTGPCKASKGIIASDSSNLINTNNVILFDGVCNFCNKWVDLLLKLDVDKKFKFASLQSNAGQVLLKRIGKEKGDISSVILVKNATTREYYSKSDVVINVLKELRLGPVPAFLVQRLLPTSLRDGIYDVVADNRYSILGKRDECRLPDKEYLDRFLT